MFCGLTIEEGWGHTLKLIYVVNGQQMERSDTYQERVRMCGVVFSCVCLERGCVLTTQRQHVR
jgi:hypothetical protein